VAYATRAATNIDCWFKQLKAFAEDKGLRYITECDIETLRAFRLDERELQRPEEVGSDANLLSLRPRIRLAAD
jgi:hypothetical protein